MDSRRGSLNTATLRRPDAGFGLRVEPGPQPGLQRRARNSSFVRAVELAFSLADPSCASDITGDGVVSFADLAKMKSVFLKTCTP